jgi:RNAse (barnase) inhibitor barstar
MTREPINNVPVTYYIDGRKIRSASDFYSAIGSAVNGPGGYFGRNLDALADCLRGGFGTPENRPYEFEWQHSAVSRRYLGNIGYGQQTLFDAIHDVFTDAGVTLRLR